MMELTGEMPLLLFTEFAGISAGAFIALFIGFARGGFTKDELRRIDVWSVLFPILALVAIICAFFHLANPGNAMNVMNTIGRSPLANEILVFGIFFVLSVIYWIIAIAGGLRGAFRVIAAGIVAAAGVVLMIFTGLAYLFPTVPPWDTPWTIIQMLGIAFFPGVVSGGYVLTTCGLGDNIYEHEPAGWALRIVMTLGAIALILATCCIFGLGALMPTITSGAESIIERAIFPFVMALVFSVVAWFCSWRSLKDNSKRGWGSVGVVCAFFAAYWCRYVFYSVQISIGL